MIQKLKLTRARSVIADLTAGTVVFLVALPLCLGVAMACGTPLFSGLLAGIVGGIIVGSLSGSHTSVSGPSPATTAIVISQIAQLGSYEAFLLAMVVGGLIQIVLGLLRAGFISAFFPSSVIQGLLAAVGTILILKQIPHVLGRDTDPQGEMSFHQPDNETTFSAFGELLGTVHFGAALIGIASFFLLIFWDRSSTLKRTKVPPPLAVIILGVVLGQLLRRVGGSWDITESHMVQVPIADGLAGLSHFLKTPDFSQWTNTGIYQAGLTLALVASLETLLNIDAVDKNDPEHRVSPPNRELLSQGIGNCLLGMIGGIPISSVIVRSSVNLNAGARTKLSAIFHGVLMLVCVALMPTYLNMIPLSCLAAILLATGLKLITPQLIHRMWNAGRYQFAPFAATLSAIVLTDLVTGMLVGMAISIGFILNSNLRYPVRRIREKHLGGDILHIVLPNQVSFLNRGALEATLRDMPPGSRVLLDAESTDYIDPDVLNLISDFKDQIAPSRDVQVSLLGFRQKYQMEDDIQFVDYSTRELQENLTWVQVLQILKEGNLRFLRGQRLTRDFNRQLQATSDGQRPLAAVLSCIDSRTPAELVFDLGIGDIFSVRMAGHVIGPNVLGSLEFACNVAGTRLILVMGHTRCSAVTSAVNLASTRQHAEEATGCQHLQPIIQELQKAIDSSFLPILPEASFDVKTSIVEAVAIRNVELCVDKILRESRTIRRLADEGKVAVVGGIFDIMTGKINFLRENALVMKHCQSSDDDSVTSSATPR
jgi:carbonic anhydrase